MRRSVIERKTNETDISVELVIDGKGNSSIDTKCGFLDHMLTLFAKHGGFDLNVSCSGDVNVDFHHTVEDVAICIGQAFREAAGDKKGINRYASLMLPMDEALVLCSCDVSGRGMIVYSANFQTEKIGDFDVQLIHEFFQSLALNAEITLHVNELYGENSHHIAEAMFKGTARVLRKAFETDPRFPGSIPTTKGVL